MTDEEKERELAKVDEAYEDIQTKALYLCDQLEADEITTDQLQLLLTKIKAYNCANSIITNHRKALTEDHPAKSIRPKEEK